MYTIGVDLGGTNIKAALVDEQGGILQEASRPTNLPRPAQAVCDDIADLCRHLMAGHTVAGVGIGCPGTVDDTDGMVLYSNNLDWSNFAMGPYLKERLGLPVRLANDANAAALGEALAGCAKGADSAVILTLGTGVGGGVVLGGKLLTGYTGAAAEPGHMVVNDAPDAPLCTCGRRGCLEAYASATALIRMTKDAMAAHPESALWKLADLDTVTGRTAFDGRDAGDAAAAAVVAEYTHWLGGGHRQPGQHLLPPGGGAFRRRGQPGRGPAGPAARPGGADGVRLGLCPQKDHPDHLHPGLPGRRYRRRAAAQR